MDLRERGISLTQKGISASQIAKQAGLAVNTVLSFLAGGDLKVSTANRLDRVISYFEREQRVLAEFRKAEGVSA